LFPQLDGQPGAGAPVGDCVAAIAAIDDAGRELVRNPNETLLLQALLLHLPALAPTTAALA